VTEDKLQAKGLRKGDLIYLRLSAFLGDCGRTRVSKTRDWKRRNNYRGGTISREKERFPELINFSFKVREA
jgi:hypothetical protein